MTINSLRCGVPRSGVPGHPVFIHQLQSANTMNTTSGIQTLKLTGLRFSANLGILESEKLAPQPIEVNAELRLGAQPLLPRDDDIVKCSNTATK